MRHILLAATALAMLSGAAYAQDSTANSGSSSTATNTSGSQSTAVSNPKVNVIGNPIGNGASSSNSGARATANTRSSSRSAAVGNSTTVNVSGYAGVEGGTGGGTTGTTSDPVRAEQYIGYGGSYTVRNTPEVIAPSIVGGNACAVGASGGVSLPGFGLAMGATWADRACERRQQAALLFNMGEQKIALELMCQDDNIRSAMKIGGKPCIADVAVAQTSAAASVAEAVAPVVKVATAAPVVVMPAAPKPEWCARAAPVTEASRTYVAQICGK